MSIKIGNNILAKSSTYHPDLFDVKWSDHIINNISWLRADTFSWHSGELYNRAYEHLANDIENKTLQYETIEDITIQFYLADDGHKICPISEENNVRFIYEKTDIAWYYIIDTDNKRFKLPRTKFAFAGIRGNVGDYVAPGLPDHSHTIKTGAAQSWLSGSGPAGYLTEGSTTASWQIQNASTSNSIYGNSNTVQSPATEMYLYFYVGNYAQSDLENVAGEMSEVLNNKADTDLSNILSNIDFVVESQFPTAENNYTWYRKYKSGWVEQGGVLTQSGNSSFSTTITFPIVMIDNNYNISFAGRGSNNTTAGNYAGVQYTNESTTGVGVYVGNDNTSYTKLCWQVSGMAAQ